MKHKYFLKLSLIFALTIGISLNGFSQDIHFTFANAQNTNDGADDYFEVDVMIQTINSTGTFKLGSGQLYFNYSNAAFGTNVLANSNVEFTQPNAEGYICGQYIDVAPAGIYGSFTVNDNTTSRVSWSYSQAFSSNTFAADNVTSVPTKLCHIKIKYADVNEAPIFMFEDGGTFDDQFETACGGTGGGAFETSDCGAVPGTQLVNDTFDSNGALLSVKGFNLVSNYKIFPNPTNGIINIEGDLTKLTSVEIYSILGQQLMTVKSDFDQLDITELQSSILFIKLNTEFGSKVIKVVKN